jgi:SAM-dependent methyltransferase
MLRLFTLTRHIRKLLTNESSDTQQVTVCRRIKGERLAYYSKAADAAFWDREWATKVHLSEYTEALKGKIGAFEKLFNSYLPREGRILEAGCGLGHVVLALRARGYNCEGVDFASKTIEAVRQLFPGLPVRVGDITHLDVPDGFYDAYISLGVMEHTEEGPELFLHEARRILAPGSIALISVPYFHALRRIKATLGFYRTPGVGEAFYQYAYTLREFSTILTRSGFEVLLTFRSGAGLGLAKELPLINRLLRLRFIGGILWRGFERLPLAGRYFGHLFIIVARRI